MSLTQSPPSTVSGSRPGHIDVAELPAPVEGSLRVSAWPDPYLKEHGHDLRSSYVELFWLGILGPSATLLARRLAIGLEQSPQGYLLPVVDTARSLGLGVPKSRQSSFVRALHRCVIFRVARFDDAGLQIHRHLPSLHAGQLERLPASLQAAHATVMARTRPVAPPTGSAD